MNEVNVETSFSKKENVGVPIGVAVSIRVDRERVFKESAIMLLP